MMSVLELPRYVEGEWIWNAALANNAGAFLLMRNSFQINAPGMDNRLWITASCSYQLFINERFIGFGPRARQGDLSSVDMYEISSEIQSGNNAVSVIVYDDPMMNPGRRHVPGMWCQLECDGRTKLKSDRDWAVRSGSFLTGPRPRCGESMVMNEIINNRDIPEHWTRAMYIPGGGWHKPDRCTAISELGAGLAIYPLAPGVPGSPLEFEMRDCGTLTRHGAWTQIVFGGRHRNGCTACAAEGYIYSEQDRKLPVRVSADDPFRIFCGSSEIVSGTAAFAETEYILLLKKGWNRLLVMQSPRQDSMGTFLFFPTLDQQELRIVSAPLENAPDGWRIAGPLKLPLNDATSSLKFERLDCSVYVPDHPVDAATCLRFSELVQNPAAAENQTLRSGAYVRLKMDILRYGVPVIVVEAEEGDILEFSLGYSPGANGVPDCGELQRSTHRLCCRRGENVFRLFYPREVMEAMIYVVRAKKTVRILACHFEELLRESLHTTSFESSSELLNQLWKIGEHTLRRSSAYVPQYEAKSNHASYLLDAYIDAVNMVATYGDHEYAATRLQQFADAQFENGDIPALSFGDGSRSQVPHLFFFPVWMAYNFRTSGSLTNLKKLEPHLDLLMDFFYSLVDTEVGLIGDLDERLQLESRLSIGKFDRESFPTYLNALFCLALIAAAEICRILERESDAEAMLEDASEIADRLRKRNFDPEVHLFRRKTERSGEDLNVEHNLFANFTALMGGLMLSDDFDVFLETYFRKEPPFDRSEEARNPYFHFLFLETMFALEHKEWAIRYFLDYWSRRICPESGSWLTWRGKPATAMLRFQNGNLVSPNVFLVREIAGIRTADPAHTNIYLNPALDAADWIDITLPTASGNIRIRWEKTADGGLSVRIESTYPLRVIPEFSAEQLAMTDVTLSENVTLLQRTPDKKEN